MSQRIDDINAIDLADLVIAFPSIDILGRNLGAEQHTLEVGVFPLLFLYLYQYQLLWVLGKHVDAVCCHTRPPDCFRSQRSRRIMIFSPNNVVSRPSSTLKLALFLSRRFIAQSKWII